MAKQRHQPPPSEPSSKSALVFLVIGALVVAGLVVWALTRTVDTPAATSSTVAEVPPAPVPNTPPPPTSTEPSTPVPAPISTATAAIATSSHAPEISGNREEVRRISAEDLREKVKAGTVTVIDVRDDAAYAAAHIPGALHVPLASVEANLDLLPKGKEIVAYCT